ncbi:hypothetical protein T265_13716, partial [Opisthorchis viverrini]
MLTETRGLRLPDELQKGRNRYMYEYPWRVGILVGLYKITECVAPGHLMSQLVRYSRYRDMYRRNTLVVRLLKLLAAY